jgi:hypothetical protein
MEFFSLNEHIDLLERQENSTQRIDLQELLESEREKVKLLEEQLETLHKFRRYQTQEIWVIIMVLGPFSCHRQTYAAVCMLTKPRALLAA